jgi:hypothetical protein
MYMWRSFAGQQVMQVFMIRPLHQPGSAHNTRRATHKRPGAELLMQQHSRPYSFVTMVRVFAVDPVVTPVRARRPQYGVVLEHTYGRIIPQQGFYHLPQCIGRCYS